jgi:hypothetical protein
MKLHCEKRSSRQDDYATLIEMKHGPKFTWQVRYDTLLGPKE